MHVHLWPSSPWRLSARATAWERAPEIVPTLGVVQGGGFRAGHGCELGFYCAIGHEPLREVAALLQRILVRLYPPHQPGTRILAHWKTCVPGPSHVNFWVHLHGQLGLALGLCQEACILQCRGEGSCYLRPPCLIA